MGWIYVKLVIVRKIICFLLAVIAAVGCAQLSVDRQKIPIVQAKRRALVIGASNFKYLGKLGYATSDAKNFRDTLINGFKFTPESIRFISDDEGSTEKPNSETILKALNSLLADPSLDKGDLFILYFSGHGIGKQESDYFCSTDTKVDDVEVTGLKVKTVLNRLKETGLRNIVVIADACRAGDESSFGGELTDLARKTNIAVLLGCEPGKKSYEAPALRSGVFTYFLLKSLSNPKNRTESGGLWASKIAQSIESSVYEYTKHDYGDNAQRPIAFADPTSDVMLAKFVDANTSRSLVDQGMVTGAQKIADELTDQVPDLLFSNNYAAALEAAKQAVSLDSNNYFAVYYASLATVFLGRNGEHEKFCDILKKSENPYFKSLGYVQSESRQTPLADRLKQLEAFWENSPKDEAHAGMVWAKSRIFAPMFACKVLLEKMLPDIKPGRLRSFFEAEIAVANNQPDQALAKYQSALQSPVGTSLIGDDVLIVMTFPLLKQLRRTADIKALIDEQLKKPTVSPLIWVTAAANLKAVGDRDQAIDLIKKRVNNQELTEEQVIICAITAGAAIPDLADELEAQVKFKPYSWKVRTAATIARGIKTKDATASAKAFEVARGYCDDDLEIISLTYSIESAIFEDAENFLNVPASKFSDVRELFHFLFVGQVSKFGDDSQKWYQLGELGLALGEGPQTMRLFKKYLKDFNARSSLGSEFYTMLFELATTTEEDDLAKFAADNPSLTEPDRSDNRLLYVAYLITKGNYADARTWFKSVSDVSEIFAPVKKSVQLILNARTGEVTPLKKFMNQNFGEAEAGVIAEGIGALALDDLGQADEALPHLSRISSLNSTLISSVTFRCIERYLKRLKTFGKSAEADEQLFQILQSNQISPGIKASYFGAKPGIKNFVASLKADTVWFSDEMFDEKNPTHTKELNLGAAGAGTIQITIGGDGLASGSVSIVGGEKYVITGRVDELGNLLGEAKSPHHTLIVEAKMLSNEFKQSEVFKKSNVGQVILFTDEKGLVARWLLPASVLKPLAVRS